MQTLEFHGKLLKTVKTNKANQQHITTGEQVTPESEKNYTLGVNIRIQHTG